MDSSQGDLSLDQFEAHIRDCEVLSATIRISI
jgi:hypothetical protein